MDFKKATDDLTATVSHQELAEALGVSVPTVRQARLDPSARAYRSPPEGWEAVVGRLARQRAEHFRKLAERMKK